MHHVRLTPGLGQVFSLESTTVSQHDRHPEMQAGMHPSSYQAISPPEPAAVIGKGHRGATQTNRLM